MFAGVADGDQYSIDVFMQANEEMRLLGEMAKIEQFYEHLFTDFESVEMDREAIMTEEFKEGSSSNFNLDKGELMSSIPWMMNQKHCANAEDETTLFEAAFEDGELI